MTAFFADRLLLFGATGDLARRKLLPSLCALDADGLLPEKLKIIGTARSEIDDSEYRNMARAALESVGYQTRDLLEAMQSDSPGDMDGVLRVDGGMSASDWTMQFLSNIIDAPVDRPVVQETTALGAAWLAGMKAGIYPDQKGFAASWKLERRFKPVMPDDERDRKYGLWKKAVAATISV